MKRKILSTFLAMLGLIIIGMSALFFLGLFKQQEAGILVESNTASSVFVDGKEVGQTPYEAYLSAGNINIKIKPQPIDGVVLDDYETKVNLVPGIKTIIKRDFKEKEEDSSSAVLSFERVGGDESYVTLATIPDGGQIAVDDNIYGNAPLRMNVAAGDHKLIVSKDEYLDMTLPIKVYKGYKLTASVKLAKYQEEKKENIEETKDTKLRQIKIDKNSVGFLRVRSGASTGFPEVAQVKPDETYDVVEEGEHGKWYKIKTGDIDGWVSAEFVTLLKN